MGRRGFLALAGLFALSALVALSFHLATAPTILRLAVGPIGSEDVRMAAAFVQSLNREKSSVRLKLVLTESLSDSAAALDKGRAELAIIRPDIAMPAKGETVLITRRFFPFIVTAKATNIERIADLRGRKIGVVNNPAGNVDLLKTILNYYEVPHNEVDIIGLSATEISAAVQSGQIDALFAVGALTARTLSQGVNLIRQAWGNDATFIAIREADALASRNRAIEPGEIVRGAFGGDPPRPADPLPTISVTHRLVSDATVADTAISELTRMILTQRATLAVEVPAMQGIEAPNTAKDSALPVHNGASAYLDGNERTFFDRYGDWFYLGVMAFSLLGSGVAAMLSQASSVRRHNAMEGLTRIVAMITEARDATALSTLLDLETEADEILAQTLENMAQQHIDVSGLSAYRLAMDQLSRAIIERRRFLNDMPEAVHEG
ncbi:MAG: ABC transporter substrate-binding protein [Hyphomicrobiales bacterium]|nr:ABC transporter substrate-binding protein [Hyphomicrobiales bacterium]